MTIRFIHAADLHLGSPFKGFSGLSPAMLKAVRESTYTAFSRLVRHAVETRPDFLLIAGDVYDGEDRSLKAQEAFRQGMAELEEAGVPVFVSHGNHDHLAGSWVRFSLPGNVRVFGPDVGTHSLDVRGRKVKIHGFSYPERHVPDPVIGKYPEAAADGAVHIGMLHGSVRGDEAHDVYAPFTTGELLAKGYDYWALGHIHQRSLLSEQPPVVYPGNLQGLHRKETGPKGFYEVTLGDGRPELEFIRTSALIFGRVDVPCGGVRHADEWISRCMDALGGFRSENGPCIADVVLCGIGPETESMFAGAPDEEWLEFLREAAEAKFPDVGIHRLTFRRDTGAAPGTGLLRDILEELDGWEEDDWKTVLADLYGHRQAYRFTERLDAGLAGELKEETERLLAAGLRTGGIAE